MNERSEKFSSEKIRLKPATKKFLLQSAKADWNKSVAIHFLPNGCLQQNLHSSTSSRQLHRDKSEWPRETVTDCFSRLNRDRNDSVSAIMFRQAQHDNCISFSNLHSSTSSEWHCCHMEFIEVSNQLIFKSIINHYRHHQH